MAGPRSRLCSGGPAGRRHDPSSRHSCSRRTFPTLRRLTPAEQLYRRALQNQPGDAELWEGLGRVCYALGQPDEAVTSLRRALRAAPRGRGTLQRSRSRADGAGPAR